MSTFLSKALAIFDQICTLLAILVGFVFCVLGILGLFVGSHAHFSLPPIAGGLPFLVGWGILSNAQKKLNNDTCPKPKKNNS